MGGNQKGLTQIPMLAPAGLQRLQQVVAEQVGAADLQAIVQKFVEKAKGGDERAARFVINDLLGARHTPATVVVNQFYDGGAVPQQAVMESATTTVPGTPLRKISAYLSVAGHSLPETISADTGLSVDDVLQTLKAHPERFPQRGRYFTLKS